jgi:hypothetical protein
MLGILVGLERDDVLMRRGFRKMRGNLSNAEDKRGFLSNSMTAGLFRA